MVDSHCHLADDAFISDLEQVVQRAQSVGVTEALCIIDPTNETEKHRFTQVVELWPSTRCAVGVHPHQAGKFMDTVDQLDGVLEDALMALPASCAIGEIGLDYHYDFAPVELQKKVFRCQLRFARDRDLPVVIHTRDADADTVSLLAEESQGRLRGVFHCFTGGETFARQALDLGFYISFSGIVTFRRAEEVRKAAKLVPSDRLLVETDSPYLAPIPHRGKRNEPAWVEQVVQMLAETREETVSDVVAATRSSFVELFGNSCDSDDLPKELVR